MLGSEGLGLGSVGTAAEVGGDGNATTPTLAQVYLAGAGDVQADDVFAMPSGNLRFVGDEGPGGVPGVALYESATTTGDSRIASWYTRRYMKTGIGVGQTVADALAGFDPTWDGTFGRLDGIKLTVARAGFTASDDQTTAAPTLVVGDASFQSFSGFFVGPVCFPTPGLNGGQVEAFVLDLWEGADLNTRGAFSFSGWGQMLARPLPLANGVTAALDFRPNWAKLTTAANDGIGIMWRAGDDDPPVAMVDAHMLTSATNGDYGLGFWARSSGTLSKIATFDWTNGIVFNAPVGTFSGGRGVQTFQSPLLDLTQVSSSTLVLQIAGFRFVPQNFGFICSTASGVTGNPTVQADVGATNLLPSQAFTAASTVVPNQRTLSLTLATPLMAPDMGSAGLVFQVTAGATATALTGRFFVTGALVPL